MRSAYASKWVHGNRAVSLGSSTREGRSTDFSLADVHIDQLTRIKI